MSKLPDFAPKCLNLQFWVGGQSKKTGYVTDLSKTDKVMEIPYILEYSQSCMPYYSLKPKLLA